MTTDTTADTYTTIDSETLPLLETAKIVAAGVGLAAVVIGARELYKRRIKKIPPLATGE